MGLERNTLHAPPPGENERHAEDRAPHPKFAELLNRGLAPWDPDAKGKAQAERTPGGFTPWNKKPAELTPVG